MRFSQSFMAALCLRVKPLILLTGAKGELGLPGEAGLAGGQGRPGEDGVPGFVGDPGAPVSILSVCLFMFRTGTVVFLVMNKRNY